MFQQYCLAPQMHNCFALSCIPAKEDRRNLINRDNFKVFSTTIKPFGAFN